MIPTPNATTTIITTVRATSADITTGEAMSAGITTEKALTAAIRKTTRAAAVIIRENKQGKNNGNTEILVRICKQHSDFKEIGVLFFRRPWQRSGGYRLTIFPAAAIMIVQIAMWRMVK